MNENPLDVLPELLLLGGAVVGLVLGLFTPRRRQGRIGVLSAVAVAAAAAAAGVQWTGPVTVVFDSYRIDDLTSAVRVIVCAALLLTLPLIRSHFAGHPRETETYVLALLAGLGAVTLAGASDLLLLMAAFTLATVPLYALVAFAKDSPGTEAGLKYYLFGAMFGLIMLAGITILFGLAGETAYGGIAPGLVQAPRGALVVAVVALVAGLAFKMGAVPAHFWVPDVTAGTTPAVAALVTTIPKVGAFAALFRLFDGPLGGIDVDWRLLLAILAAASMTLGNLAAFFQADPRRLLAYSTISQVGYLMLPVVVAGRVEAAGTALLFYLAAYAAANVGAFAVVAARPRLTSLDAYRGLGSTATPLAVSLAVSLLGLVGTPPLAVFVGKFTVFSAAAAGGYAWLVVLAAVNTVASLFYYLRWIAPAFSVGAQRDNPDRVRSASLGLAQAVAYACAVTGLVLGLVAGLAFGTSPG